MMLTIRRVLSIFPVSLLILGSGAATSQNFPNKPIHIVTSAPGGGNDFISRLIAQGTSIPLGQPVIVDNRTGIVSIETVARAQPDGYTLLFQSNILWLSPFLQQVTYDPVRDFSPLALVALSPGILVVHPSLPVKSVKELIALAKARPKELNYASSGAGGSTHLAAELFKAMAKVDIVCITYRGGGPALTALFGGEVQVQFPTAGAVAPHIKSSRLRALAVTSAQPSTLVPGLPPLAAAGVPGYESVTHYSMFAPAKTPTDVINRLNQEIVRLLRTAEAKERLLNTGVEAMGSSPEELAATVRSNMAGIGKVIKDAGIRVE